MPELPEVEANAKNLARWAIGRRITGVLPPPGTRETGGVSPKTFADRLQGRLVEAVVRRGKWILLALSGGGGLGLHLGMTGKIVHAAQDEVLPRFSRAVFDLDDRHRICFVDRRRFGRLLAVDHYSELLTRKELSEIGRDALEVTPTLLKVAFERTERTVKEVLMDQRVLAGVGNLYATEALWRAAVHPARKARLVARNSTQLTRLADGIRQALRHGLHSAAAEEVVPEYVEEGAPNPFHVYDRTGAPCHRCGTKLGSLTISGRTSTYCPKCQKLP